jgi:hypothetical protein
VQGSEVKRSAIIGAASGEGLAEQAFEFGGVEPGTYDLVISKPACPRYVVRNVAVGEGSLDLADDSREGARRIALLCGDIDGDGSIGAKDLSLLLSSDNYMKGASSAKNPLADLDGDRTIGAKDLSILLSAANYLKGEVVVE